MTVVEAGTSTSDQGVPLGVIETDTFCPRCGFNLHTQKVWRDERLAILVCRCPECGSHHAVGSESSVGRKWMQRFATIGVLIWVMICFAFLGGFALMSFGIHASMFDGLTYHSLETLDGRLVNSAWTPGGALEYQLTSDPAVKLKPTEVIDRQKLTPALTGNYPPESYTNYYYGQYYTQLTPIIIVGSIFACALLFSSAVLSACCWFWRRGRRWIWLLIPLATGLIAHEVLRNETSVTQRYGTTGVTQIESTLPFRLIYLSCFLQMILMAVAIYFGRPFARFLLAVFVPPKTRQLFAFLWHCDGKTMPPARPAHERH